MPSIRHQSPSSRGDKREVGGKSRYQGFGREGRFDVRLLPDITPSSDEYKLFCQSEDAGGSDDSNPT